MRKQILFMVAVLLVGVFPAFAQEMPGTIADIVVASTQAETPEFTTLLTAVQAADPAVLETLSDPEQQLTVFAPTDAAFAALAESLGEDAFADVLADEELLTSILLFHVAPGLYASSDVVAALETAEGAPVGVGTLQGQYINITQDEDEAIWIDGAMLNLEMVDIEASNGVIHVIDAVLMPEMRTIADIVTASTEAETPEFTTLLAAVVAADPAVLEALSDPEAMLTVFAPTDEAFAALGEDTINAVLADQELLTSILMYHVVPSVVRSSELADMLAEGGGMLEVETAQGAVVTLAVADDGSVSINDVLIVMTDIDAGNGVIHVINGVLMPPEGE